MNGFNDKELQRIWDSLGLPADVQMQEDFERMACEWHESRRGLVRCKDCKHMRSYEHLRKIYHEEWLWCYSPRFESVDGEPVPVEPDGFCSWAEPRAVD